MVHSIGAGCHGGQLDFFHRQARVLEVEPERIEPAMFTQDFDQLRANELPEARKP